MAAAATTTTMNVNSMINNKGTKMKRIVIRVTNCYINYLDRISKGAKMCICVYLFLCISIYLDLYIYILPDTTDTHYYNDF